MSAVLAQRLTLTAAVTLLGVVIALGVARQLGAARGSNDLPRAAPAPGGGWYRALAGLESAGADGRQTACGTVLERHSPVMFGANVAVLKSTPEKQQRKDRKPKSEARLSSTGTTDKVMSALVSRWR